MARDAAGGQAADMGRKSTLIDLHAHILPGLDDGASCWEEAEEMLEIADRDGIARLAATPHFIEGGFEPDRREIMEGVERLNRYAERRGLAVRVMPGMEVALSPAIPGWLREGRLLTLNDEGRHLLLEMPVIELPFYTDTLLFELQLMGIVPVLAHPERNRAIQQNPAWLIEAVERGVLVQITADSLLGAFGRSAMRAAGELLNAGAVHALGSDAHSSQRRTPTLSAAAARLDRLLGRERTKILLKAGSIVTGNRSEEAAIIKEQRKLMV